MHANAIWPRIDLCRVAYSCVWLRHLRAPSPSARAPSRRAFYDDDPITREPETAGRRRRASRVDIGLCLRAVVQPLRHARRRPSNTRALNINTIDEVPDSSWFTNRIGARRLSTERDRYAAQLGRPPRRRSGSSLGEKSSGTNPGFTAQDANGETWFLPFDRPAIPEGASGAVVIATKLFWALGYNQVETFITTFDPAQVDDRPESDHPAPVWREDAVHARRPRRGARARGAERRWHLSRRRRPLLPGKVLGGFRYAGTRPDDPNDLVPHEHRRELRALRVFGAWTNLTDLKAGNTLDTLVTENGRAVVKHYLQDVGSTFGMANGPHEWDMGGSTSTIGRPTRQRLLSFGFALSPWQTVPYRAIRRSAASRATASTRRRGSRRRRPRRTWRCAPTMRSGRRDGSWRSPTT